MSEDYGPYGKGLDGYVHYMQAFEESNKGGGGGGKKPSNNSGCLTSVINILGAVSILIFLLA